MRAKIARNMLHYCSILADWEGARLASALGIEVEKFVELVKTGERWSGGRMGYGTLLSPDGDTSLEQDLARYADKDLKVALGLGHELGVELPVAELAETIFAVVARTMPPDGSPS